MGKTFSTGLLTNGLWQDSSNNIGIGAAANASFKLQVTGATNLTGALSGTSATFTNASGAFIAVTATTTDATGSARLRVTSTGSNINDFSSFSASHPTRANQAWIGGDGSSTTTVLQAGGTEFLRGTSTGAATFSSSVTAGGDITIPNGNYYYARRNTGGSAINVMGFAAASDTLVIKGGTSGAAVSMQFQDTAGPVMSLYNGNVGIGTSSPTNGKLEIQTTSTTAALWVQTGGTTSASTIVDFRTGSNLSALNILGNGVATFGSSVAVGDSVGLLGELYWGGFSSGQKVRAYPTGSSGSATLNFAFWNGSAWGIQGSLTSAGVWSTTGGGTSDARTKEDIDYSFDNGVESILKLQPTKFKFKISPNKQRRGFIAQDVLTTIPDLVLGDGEKENGTYGLDYDGILAIAVKAIQEQQAQIEELKAIVSTK
jgi:hypothetical protein